jgi:hypothetical protein
VEGLFLLGGLGFAFALMFPLVLLVALLVILAIRHDNDAEGTRAPAVYGAVVAFLALFTLLFAATAMVTSLLDLTKDDDSFQGRQTSSGFEDEFGEEFGGGMFDVPSFGDDRDSDDRAVAGAVVALIVGAVAIGVLVLHRPLFARRHHVTGAGARVVRAYHLVVGLVAVVLGVVAVAVFLYGLFSVAAPGISGAGDRGAAARGLVPAGVLAVGAALLFRWHTDEAGLFPPVTGRAGPDDPRPPGFSATDAP